VAVLIYQIYSKVNPLALCISVCMFLFFSLGGAVVFGAGFHVNHKLMDKAKCAKRYYGITSVAYYFSMIVMAVGCTIVFAGDNPGYHPLYGGFGLFLSSGIMRDKLRKIIG